jgi:diguanylate cyclase (GGDEF)-like protein
VITRAEADRLRDQLVGVLDEDAHNTQRLLGRLDAISRETGVGAHSALLMILTRLAFDEAEARKHWERILQHRNQLDAMLDRPVAVRVAVLDYFLNVNRQLLQPTLIDLEMADSEPAGATVDRLTGLANDRVFRSALQHELRRARRYGQKASIVLFDIDGFGVLGERFGRLLGDRLLREAAMLLKNRIRDIDVAARPGDDEFALLLPETDRNDALLVAERYREHFEQHFAGREIAGEPAALTVSGGVASYPGDASAAAELLQRAAEALYRAKAMGRNVIQVYCPERRQYLRFELAPGRFEVEILAPGRSGGGALRDVSRNGILFSSPEPIGVGESIEIRLADSSPDRETHRVRGVVVRLEELPAAVRPTSDAQFGADRYEVGVALELSSNAGNDLMAFLESLQDRRLVRRS